MHKIRLTDAVIAGAVAAGVDVMQDIAEDAGMAAAAAAVQVIIKAEADTEDAQTAPLTTHHIVTSAVARGTGVQHVPTEQRLAISIDPLARINPTRTTQRARSAIG